MDSRVGLAKFDCLNHFRSLRVHFSLLGWLLALVELWQKLRDIVREREHLHEITIPLLIDASDADAFDLSFAELLPPAKVVPSVGKLKVNFFL